MHVCFSLKMASTAILMLLLLERFLASDMDDFTEPVLSGLRVVERSALKHTRNVIQPRKITKHRKLTKFFIFNRLLSNGGQSMNLQTCEGCHFFNPYLETKIIVHGFLDKVVIAEWMHHMKDEFLLMGDFNVIVVDWSSGNFLPYTKAAGNTEQVGGEIADLLKILVERYGAQPEKIHLLGHSLGAHVCGYVGERIKGLKRITGLDPATYQFSNASPRSKLDKTDAIFVDVIHTDGGGIGMKETVGHVDFYPNGGEVQVGCTASNSFRSLLEKGVLEGARNVICSHMRAPLIFTDTINSNNCQMLASACESWESYIRGDCNFCQRPGAKCAEMGYHVDLNRDYGNDTKYFLMTYKEPTYCGFEYKLTMETVGKDSQSGVLPTAWRKNGWSSSDILNIVIHGSRGTTQFKLEGENDSWHNSHVIFSRTHLGDIVGAVLRWHKKPLTRARGVMDVISNVIQRDPGHLVITSIEVTSLKAFSLWDTGLGVYNLCINPLLTGQEVHDITFRKEFC